MGETLFWGKSKLFWSPTIFQKSYREQRQVFTLDKGCQRDWSTWAVHMWQLSVPLCFCWAWRKCYSLASSKMKSFEFAVKHFGKLEKFIRVCVCVCVCTCLSVAGLRWQVRNINHSSKDFEEEMNLRKIVLSAARWTSWWWKGPEGRLWKVEYIAAVTLGKMQVVGASVRAKGEGRDQRWFRGKYNRI